MELEQLGDRNKVSGNDDMVEIEYVYYYFIIMLLYSFSRNETHRGTPLPGFQGPVLAGRFETANKRDLLAKKIKCKHNNKEMYLLRYRPRIFLPSR